MKILSVAFDNIKPFNNSWTIDLSDPNNDQGGIFSLSSSQREYEPAVINAITLALYGSAVKYGKLSGLDKKIFVDGAKKGSATVLFSQKGREYKASWSVELVQGVPSVDWSMTTIAGEIFPEAAAGLEDAIEKLTGIGFQRFEKLIYFATNHFKTFLISPLNYRSYILEGIIGKTISPFFPQITESIVRQKRTATEISKKMLEAYHLLPVKDEEKLLSSLGQAQDKTAKGKIRLAKLEEELNWLTRIDALKEDYQKVLKEESILKSDIARFDLKRNVLEKANKALTLAGQFNKLKQLRDNLAEAQKNLSEKKKETPHYQEKERLSGIALQDKDRSFRQAEFQHNKKLEQLQKLKELESRTEELSILHKDRKDEFDVEAAEVKISTEICAELKKKIGDNKTRLTAVQKKLTDLGVDDNLAKNLPSYRNKLDEVDLLNADIESNSKNHKTTQKALDKLKLEIQDNESALTSLKKEELVLQTEITQKTRSLSKLLGNTDPEILKKEAAAFEDRINGLNELAVQNEKLQQLFEQLANEKDLLSKNQSDHKLATIVLNNAMQTLKDKRTIVANCRQLLEFHQKVRQLESFRHTLENGKPCPLCGAVIHPYVASAPSDVNAEEQLNTALAEENTALSAYQDASDNVNRLSVQITSSDTAISNATKELEQLKAAMIARANTLEVVGFKEKKPNNWALQIKQKLSLLVNKRDEINGKINQSNAFQTVVDESGTKLDDIRREIQLLSEHLNSKKTESSQLSAQQQRYLQIDNQYSNRRDELLKELERLYLRHNLKATNSSMLRQQFPILENKINLFLELTEERIQLIDSLESSEKSLSSSSTVLADHKARFDSLSSEIDRLESEARRLNKDRTELFGSQSSVDFGAATEKEFQAQKASYEEVRRNHEEKRSETDAFMETLNQLQSELDSLTEKVGTETNKFNSAVKALGFISEGQFAAARISEAQHQELQQQSDELDARSKDVYGRKEEKELALRSEEKLKLTAVPLPKIRDDIEKAKSELSENLRVESELSEKLEHNNYTKQRFQREQADYGNKLNAQTHWEQVNEMVKIATPEDMEAYGLGLAFEVLLDYASKQLSLLDPRLTLARDEAKPYEIRLVTDLDLQRAKPTKHFNTEDVYLVSLALAVSLYQLESTQVNLETLLVGGDMPVGTESLKTAFLATLNRLRKQGKQVCIVTNDSAVMELIGSTISIEQQTAFPSEPLQG